MRPRTGHFVRDRLKSFGYAFEGWWYVLRTQPNAWIHAFFSTVVFIAGFWVGLERVEWAVLILTFTVVWMAEFLNTAVESIVDMVMPNYHPLAKVAKDVAAAAVLICALGSILVGLLILGPPLAVEFGWMVESTR